MKVFDGFEEVTRKDLIKEARDERARLRPGSKLLTIDITNKYRNLYPIFGTPWRQLIEISMGDVSKILIRSVFKRFSKEWGNIVSQQSLISWRNDVQLAKIDWHFSAEIQVSACQAEMDKIDRELQGLFRQHVGQLRLPDQHQSRFVIDQW